MSRKNPKPSKDIPARAVHIVLRDSFLPLVVGRGLAPNVGIKGVSGSSYGSCVSMRWGAQSESLYGDDGEYLRYVKLRATPDQPPMKDPGRPR